MFLLSLISKFRYKNKNMSNSPVVSSPVRMDGEDFNNVPPLVLEGRSQFIEDLRQVCAKYGETPFIVLDMANVPAKPKSQKKDSSYKDKLREKLKKKLQEKKKHSKKSKKH